MPVSLCQWSSGGSDLVASEIVCSSIASEHLALVVVDHGRRAVALGPPSSLPLTGTPCLVDVAHSLGKNNETNQHMIKPPFGNVDITHDITQKRGIQRFSGEGISEI